LSSGDVDPIVGTVRCHECDEWHVVEQCILPPERTPDAPHPLSGNPPDGCWAHDGGQHVELIADCNWIGKVCVRVAGRDLCVDTLIGPFRWRRRLTNVSPKCVRIISETIDGGTVDLIWIWSHRTVKFGWSLNNARLRWLAGGIIEALGRTGGESS
jgi:hypothetical protein